MTSSMTVLGTPAPTSFGGLPTLVGALKLDVGPEHGDLFGGGPGEARPQRAKGVEHAIFLSDDSCVKLARHLVRLAPVLVVAALVVAVLVVTVRVKTIPVVVVLVKTVLGKAAPVEALLVATVPVVPALVVAVLVEPVLLVAVLVKTVLVVAVLVEPARVKLSLS